MKSLLSRKRSLLDTAPSFLVRQKSSNAISFAAPVEDSNDAPPEEDIDSTQRATRVMPLRTAASSAMNAGAKALDTAQIAEVERLVQQAALATFRTFQSFAYSASLLFHPRELIYYAVLYHEGAVWRVLKASEIDVAEPAFRHFVEQAIRLADAEMRRALVEAQNEQIARFIADAETQIERVRADLQRGNAQSQEVALKQQDVRKELAQLEGRSVASQVQLNKLQRQLHQLNASVSETLPHLPQKR
ncbi:signal peptide protein [Caballeronia peredens]|nr:signal peptide protein [Caballeronia peredens]